MFFLLSGEGPTDLGRCVDPVELCRGEAYRHGPMAVVVDQVVDDRHHYSPLVVGVCGLLPKRRLTDRAGELKAMKKSLGLPGQKRRKETRYFYNNARVLSRIALELEKEIGDGVVAVFFRDSDGTQSANRGLWEDKVQSMLDGFSDEGFARGVPMIPKPKSEAWVLCALKHGYQSCGELESRSGNDNSPDSLKSELADYYGHPLSSDELVELIDNREIDINRLDMPSFLAFRMRLETVI